MITFAVFVDIFELHFLARGAFSHLECLEDGARVAAAAAHVVDFSAPRLGNKQLDKPGKIVGVDVVSHLFAFVAINPVNATRYIYFDQVTEETMQFNMKQPDDWMAAFKKQAARDGQTLAEWVGECLLANLDPDLRRGLSKRRPAHRPRKEASK